MTDAAGESAHAGDAALDVGAYCRAIEAHLCVRNGGHRIRVIGPAFDLARAWHRDGIPLKVVERGIDRRVERAEQRGVRRPLRLEFCETDVQQAYADWRRAVGPMAGRQAGEAPPDAADHDAPRVRSLPRHLERVATRLSSAIVQLPDGPLRRLGAETLERVDEMRAGAARLRGDAREALHATLAGLDEQWNVAVLAHADPAVIARGHADADRDLASYRGRMPADEYARAVRGLTARAVRDALGLPRLAP
jgi:hypothetical protein